MRYKEWADSQERSHKETASPLVGDELWAGRPRYLLV